MFKKQIYSYLDNISVVYNRYFDQDKAHMQPRRQHIEPLVPATRRDQKLRKSFFIHFVQCWCKLNIQMAALEPQYARESLELATCDRVLSLVSRILEERSQDWMNPIRSMNSTSMVLNLTTQKTYSNQQQQNQKCFQFTKAFDPCLHVLDGNDRNSSKNCG